MMKYLSTLMAILAFSYFFSASAQIVDEYRTTAPDGGTILDRSVYVTDPVTGEKVLINQKYREISDGGLIPVPGAKSAEEKEILQDICRRAGGKDTTEDSNIVLGAGTLTGGICEMPIDTKSPAPARVAPRSSLGTEGEEVFPIR